MAGIPRPTCRSLAGREAQCQPLEKEANATVRGYYYLSLSDLQCDKNDNIPVCSPLTPAGNMLQTDNDRVHDPLTKELQHLGTQNTSDLFISNQTGNVDYSDNHLNPVDTFVSVFFSLYCCYFRLQTILEVKHVTFLHKIVWQQISPRQQPHTANRLTSIHYMSIYERQ